MSTIQTNFNVGDKVRITENGSEYTITNVYSYYILEGSGAHWTDDDLHAVPKPLTVEEAHHMVFGAQAAGKTAMCELFALIRERGIADV